jgi:hypothetical protein
MYGPRDGGWWALVRMLFSLLFLALIARGVELWSDPFSESGRRRFGQRATGRSTFWTVVSRGGEIPEGV